MAIVINKADGAAADRSYKTHSRTTAASPNTVTTPAFVGEIVFDTTNKVRWRAIGPANTEWIPLEAEVT